MGARNPDPEIYAEFVEKMTRINRENKEKRKKQGKKHSWETHRINPKRVMDTEAE